MKYYILKPKKLNLENLVKNYQPDFNFSIDKAYLIIYLIIKFSNKKDNFKKVELSSKMLQSLIGKDYNKYIDFLLENYFGHGNILNGFKYSKNHPFSYKLSNYFFYGGFELYELTNYKLINKYKSLFVKNQINEQIRLNYFFLLKHFNQNKIDISEPFVAVDSTNALQTEKGLKNALELVNFMNGEYNLTLKCHSDGRVHSNLTRLSKKSRQFLQYEGENLAEIDISSAVPFILYLVIQFYINNNLAELSKFIYSKNNLFTYMLDEVTGDIEKTELNDFGKAIINGKLYEQFSELLLNQDLYEYKGLSFDKVIKYYQFAFNEMFGYYFDGDMDDLKKFAKKRFLSMLFAPTNKYIFEQVVFMELYPSIHKFIEEYKNAYQYKDSETMIYSKKERHKKLSHLCFQFEAKVMIDNIAREFDKLHKGKVPIFTIHDCLLTIESHAEELKIFMENKFVELFGIAPNLTVEFLNFNKEIKQVV